MVKIENHCCDCATPSYPCRGSSCPLRREEVHYCDECKREIEEREIVHVDGEEYCEDCFNELFCNNK
jgi:hypothetical protein